MRTVHPTQLAFTDLCQLKSLSRHLVFPLQTAPNSEMSGHYLSQVKGQGMEFDDVRAYLAGDDIRAIDWRVTARTGKAHTKQFRQEKERPVWIVSDFTGSMQFGSRTQLKSVLAGRLLAMLAWHARYRGDRIGGIVFNNDKSVRISPENTDGCVHRLLRQACELQHSQSLQTCADNRISDTLAQLIRYANPGSYLCIISDWETLDENANQRLNQLFRHHNVMLYRIVDPLEQGKALTSKQAMWVTDGETESLQQFEAHTSQTYCQNLAVTQYVQHLVSFTTRHPLEQQLFIRRPYHDE